jgi:2-aminoethylphosphonate-pyruvate transaminase
MRAVILAAGMGTRLGDVSANAPKGLLEIDGRPLLEYSLEALHDQGIAEAVVVAGFLPAAIEERFGARYKGTRLRYVRNAEYATTGSMHSLLQAKEVVAGDDVLVLESDLLYEPRAIAVTMNAPHENVILAAAVSGSGDEVYLVTDERGTLTDLGKNLGPDQRSRAAGELVGISRYSPRFLDEMFRQEEHDHRNGARQRHYEETVLAVTGQHGPVHVVVCPDLTWTEIDKPEDLERARRSVFPRLHRGEGSAAGRH